MKVLYLLIYYDAVTYNLEKDNKLGGESSIGKLIFQRIFSAFEIINRWIRYLNKYPLPNTQVNVKWIVIVLMLELYCILD